LLLLNKRDKAHTSAVAAANCLIGDIVTTDWAIVEVADALSHPVHRARVVRFLNELRRSLQVEVVSSSAHLLELGWNLYSSRLDKDWSLTDCISFVVMQERGLTDALTGDHHFEQAGFNAVLR
jgi:predicted nucleic acid-binding protein